MWMIQNSVLIVTTNKLPCFQLKTSFELIVALRNAVKIYVLAKINVLDGFSA